MRAGPTQGPAEFGSAVYVIRLLHFENRRQPSAVPSVLSRTSSTEAVRPEMTSNCASSIEVERTRPQRMLRRADKPDSASAAPKGTKSRTFVTVSSSKTGSRSPMASLTSPSGVNPVRESASVGVSVAAAISRSAAPSVTREISRRSFTLRQSRTCRGPDRGVRSAVCGLAPHTFRAKRQNARGLRARGLIALLGGLRAEGGSHAR
jgi:hypothetical protein